MFTIEYAPKGSFPAWQASRQRYKTYFEAATALASWMSANYDHGVDIQGRVVVVEDGEAAA